MVCEDVKVGYACTNSDKIIMQTSYLLNTKFEYMQLISHWKKA